MWGLTTKGRATYWTPLRPLFQIDVLPEIVEAVQGRAEVYLDGGVRLGTDVFKALALGARAVFVGRPALWGLASQVGNNNLQLNKTGIMPVHLAPVCA